MSFKNRKPLSQSFNDNAPTEPAAVRKRNGLTIRGYLGCCLICRHGCFAGDPITRGRGKLLGLMHTACAKPAETAAAGRTAPPEGSAKGERHSGAQEAVG